jgi:hypothetical protein
MNFERHPIAIRHPIEKVKKSRFAMSRCSDFTLLPGTVLTTALPEHSYLPYQYCSETDEYLMVDTPICAFDQPFLYLAQYDCATHVVSVPRKSLENYLPNLGTSGPCTSVLIFSIGRCGSTLLSKLLSKIGYFCFSENDVYTGLFGIENCELRRRVVLETTWMLNEYSGVPSRDIAIKMRAGCNVSFADIHSALPEARYVFVTRKLKPWVESYFGKFDVSNENLAEILKCFVESVGLMKKRGLPFSLLRYEDFTRQPGDLLTVFGRSSADNEAFLLHVPDVLSRDAQEGAGICDLLSGAQLAQRCDDFQKFWNKVRPAADIEYAGLEM